MPLISIVIPTCNRSNYLLPMLDTLLSRVDDVEIIVSDNSDTDALSKSLEYLISTGRIHYQFISTPISVVENFELSVALATGVYVTCLGDDDCIGPGFNEVVSWAQENDIEAVYSYAVRFIANYFWPGVKSRYFGDGYQSKLFLRKYTGNAERIDGIKAVRVAAKNMGSGLGFMPRIYHGIVKRSLLDHIRDKYGSVFGGVSPDIYSATLISLEAKHIYRIDAPFILPGGSPRSTAGHGAAHTDRSDFFEVDHIRRFGSDLVWSPIIPMYYAPYIVWAYSMHCALENSGSKVAHLNLMGLGLKCWIGDYRYHRQISAAMREGLKRYGYLVSGRDLLFAVVNECISITRRIYWKTVAKSSVFGGITDIGLALDVIEQQERNRNFDLRTHLDQSVK